MQVFFEHSLQHSSTFCPPDPEVLLFSCNFLTSVPRSPVFFPLSPWKCYLVSYFLFTRKGKKKEKRPEAKRSPPPFCKQVGSVFYKGRSLVVEQCAVSNSKTYRRSRFPSFRSADQSEILGLVSTEWGRRVFCHHWYVARGRCWDRNTMNQASVGTLDENMLRLFLEGRAGQIESTCW